MKKRTPEREEMTWIVTVIAALLVGFGILMVVLGVRFFWEALDRDAR